MESFAYQIWCWRFHRNSIFSILSYREDPLENLRRLDELGCKTSKPRPIASLNESGFIAEQLYASRPQVDKLRIGLLTIAADTWYVSSRSQFCLQQLLTSPTSLDHAHNLLSAHSSSLWKLLNLIWRNLTVETVLRVLRSCLDLSLSRWTLNLSSMSVEWI